MAGRIHADQSNDQTGRTGSSDWVLRIEPAASAPRTMPSCFAIGIPGQAPPESCRARATGPAGHPHGMLGQVRARKYAPPCPHPPPRGGESACYSNRALTSSFAWDRDDTSAWPPLRRAPGRSAPRRARSSIPAVPCGMAPRVGRPERAGGRYRRDPAQDQAAGPVRVARTWPSTSRPGRIQPNRHHGQRPHAPTAPDRDDLRSPPRQHAGESG